MVTLSIIYTLIGLFSASWIILNYKPWYAEVNIVGFIVAIVLWPVFIFAFLKDWMKWK